MLRKLGFEWQGAHVFEAADTNNDGKVDFEEFLAVFGDAAFAAKGRIKPAKGQQAAASSSKAAAPAKGKAAPAKKRARK